MRLTLPLALATATAFSVYTLPVRAMPQAGLNLVRIDNEGVQPLPDLQKLSAASRSALPSAGVAIPADGRQADPLISQAASGSGTAASATDKDAKLLPTGKEDWTICYNGPLPNFDSFEYLSIRNPKNGEEVERISLTSSRISYSQDRTCMTIDPETEIEIGEKFCALLPDGPNPLPSRRDQEPCCFTVAPPAAAAAPAGGGPWWLLIIPVAGVAICALAGCFNGGGDGGGARSSR
ncbi:hypothetical protein [Synechococcus sp. GFB01]|uniref:hypothetical protein n=1 Tax=Synechococcus sp. GFB01 TaxID=1662190 RepID=UPI00064F6F8F|nr:hypothetical protein [Synechococcus sp. GFB01]KMM17376.1 hypothetical protein SYNGFB01_04380 [Synechococcus sp. GFB01]